MNPDIYIIGEINKYQAMYFVNQLKSLEARGVKEIHCEMSTHGGSAIASLEMMDAMKEFDGIIHINCRQNVSSAGIFILAAANGERSAHENCEFMFHELRNYPYGEKETVTDAQDNAARKLNVQERLNKPLMAITGLDKEGIHELIVRDNYMFADGAKEIGLLTKINSKKHTNEEDDMKLSELRAYYEPHGLSADASEKDVIAFAKSHSESLVAQTKSLKAENEKLEEIATNPAGTEVVVDSTELSAREIELEKENKLLKEKNDEIVAASSKSQKETIIAEALKNRQITPNSKDKLMALDIKSIEAIISMNEIGAIGNAPEFSEAGDGEKSLTAQELFINDLVGIEPNKGE